jgi:hypothetical protein
VLGGHAASISPRYFSGSGRYLDRAASGRGFPIVIRGSLTSPPDGLDILAHVEPAADIADRESSPLVGRQRELGELRAPSRPRSPTDSHEA